MHPAVEKRSFSLGGMPLLASIDIGTNSALLLIASLKDGVLQPVSQKVAAPRVGRGLAQSGRIADEAFAALLDALHDFLGEIKKARARLVGAVATEAFRKASNGAPLLKQVTDTLGVEARILSGEEESRLGYLAVSNRHPLPNLTVLDVGGGSTETTTAAGGTSRPIGAVNLLEACGLDVAALRARARAAFAGESQPVLSKEAAAGKSQSGSSSGTSAATSQPVLSQGANESQPDLSREAAAGKSQPGSSSGAAPASTSQPVLSQGPDESRPTSPQGPTHLVAVGGTATALALLELALPAFSASAIEGAEFDRAAVTRQIERLAAMPESERAALPGLGPGRADILVPGLCILEAFLEAAGCERFRVSDRGIRYGVVLDAVAR